MKNRYLIYFILSGIILGSAFSSIIHDNIEGAGKSNAFNYLYMPNNSFGIKEIVTYNWSFFWNKFNSVMDWNLEGSYDKETWNDVPNNYYTWVKNYSNDNSYVKMTFIFDAPVTAYYRLWFKINTDVLQYIEKNNYEVLINYTVPNGTYQCFFNFSDVKNLIQNNVVTVQKGLSNNFFYCMFTTVNVIQQGIHFELDPIFGYDNGFVGGGNIYSIKNHIAGTLFQMNNESGVVDNITARVLFFDVFVDKDTKALIYHSNLTLVGESDRLLISGAGWTYYLFTWNFSNTTNLVANEYYYLCLFGEDSVPDGGLYSHVNNSFDVNESKNAGYPSPINPVIWDSNHSNRLGNIYCSYTVITPMVNVSGNVVSIYPVNNSIEICPYNFGINLTLTHINATFMDIVFETNKTGTWTVLDIKFDNVNNGTYGLMIVNSTQFGYDYYIRVTIYNFDDYTTFNRTIYKYTMTSNINCSVGLTENQANDLYLSALFDVEPDILIFFFAVYLFYLANKHEDFMLSILSGIFFLVLGIHFIREFTLIDTLVVICFMSVAVYCFGLSWLFALSLRKKQNDPNEYKEEEEHN